MSLPIRLRMVEAGDLLTTRTGSKGISLQSINRQPAHLYIPSMTELEFTEPIRHERRIRKDIQTLENILLSFGRIANDARLATFMRYTNLHYEPQGALCFADILWVDIRDIEPGQEARVLQVGRDK